jgi:cytochrome c
MSCLPFMNTALRVAFSATLALAASEALAVSDLHKKHGCTACHADDKKLIGPAYMDVAKRYAKEWKSADGKVTVKPADAEKYLFEKVRKGASGNWGAIPMPAAAASVSDDDVRAMVKSVLDMAKSSAPAKKK